MSTHAADTSVKHSIVVDAPIEHAFKVFTEDFGRFKPAEHNLLGAPIAETVFEPRVGGHLYDRGVDGGECRWARVLAYDQPTRVLLSWHITPQGRVQTDPEKTSEWEWWFTPEPPKRNRVRTEHRQLDSTRAGRKQVQQGVGGA